MKLILTKEEIQKFGFTYEPDATKCKTRKLKLYVPKVIDDDYKDEVAKEIPYEYVHEVKETSNPYEGDPNFLADPKVLVVGHTDIMKPPVSFNGTENLIQNYCVTFSHNFNHQYSRIKNNFVVKGAPLTKENALKIAEILFPKYTDIIIESIENDENTLTPSEYHFLQGILKEKRQGDLGAAEQRIINGVSNGPYVETDYDKYILMLIKKMEARMDQFPVYHT